MIRMISLALGIPVFLFGLLATIVAVGMIGGPGPQGAQAVVGVQIVIAGIMAATAIAGGCMIWFALRGRTSQQTQAWEHQSTSTSANQTRSAQDAFSEPMNDVQAWMAAHNMGVPTSSLTRQMGIDATHSGTALLDPPDEVRSVLSSTGEEFDDIETSYGLLPREPGSGVLLGTCGPKKSGNMLSYLFGGIEIVVGAFCFGFLEFFAKPGHEEAARVAGYWCGGLLLLKGFALVAMEMLRPPQKLTMYDDRLVEEKGDNERTIPVDEISKMHIQEFFEHRFADQIFNVTLTIRDGEKLKFSTDLGGDAELIVDFLSQVVPDVSYREFS